MAHRHFLYLAKARRCCSPRDSMLAQSAVVSRPRPAPSDTRSSKGPSCTCRKTWHMSWSEGTARVLLDDGEASVPLESPPLVLALGVASLLNTSNRASVRTLPPGSRWLAIAAQSLPGRQTNPDKQLCLCTPVTFTASSVAAYRYSHEVALLTFAPYCGNSCHVRFCF